jgi:enoyl-CoA hydratase/carnithine racemase
VAAETLGEFTAKWADDMAQRAPIALALTKRAARLAMSTGLSDALTLEAELQTVCASTEDSREAIAAFREKRSPTFQGR